MAPEQIHPIFENATAKQHEALRLAARHLTSKEIAKDLGVAPATVDKRIDAVRIKTGSLPRAEVLRLYIEWLEIRGDRTTGDPIPLTVPSVNQPSAAPQPTESVHLFQDSLIFDDRAPWDGKAGGLISGIEPSDLGMFGKVLFMLAGAIAILMAVVLSLAVSNALVTLLEIG